MISKFGNRETISYKPLCLHTRTHKLPEGEFEGIAALYFGGNLCNEARAVAPTRTRARTLAEKAIERRSTR